MKKTAALAGTALALILPAAAPGATLGTKKVHARVETEARGVVQAFRFKAPFSGRVNRLNVYLDGRNTARKVRVGLYTGSGSRARVRRAQCLISIPRAGAWSSCSTAAARIKSGRSYWLALLQPARSQGRLRYRVRKAARGAAVALAMRGTRRALPARWRQRATSRRGYLASMYADQATPDSVSPSPSTPLTEAPGSSPTPSPGPSGFPGAANTGVPAGTTLSAYSGPSTITTPGAVISAKTMGCIQVRAAGVVIRNSKISCSGGYAVLSGDGDYSGERLLIEDTEIDCKDDGGHAIGEANITARRVNIHGCENGGDINQNVTVEDSYIHDLYNENDAHTDGFQLADGHFENGQSIPGTRNVTFRHNTIYGMGADGSFGTSAIISNSGGDTNILIENNLMAGGAYTLYCEQNATGINYRVINNHFSRKFGPKVGFFGASTECSDETQSGNVIHETGQPITLD
jgi:hypothetical protein